MALYHLSGDEDSVGKSAKRTAKKAKRKAKPKKKRVAKVLLAPARAAFLTVVELNLLKTGTKLARVWTSSGGKEDLIKFWKQFAGDPEKLKKAIAKGSKQTISGASMGAVGVAAIATATPIIVEVVKLIGKFKAGGDDKEKKEFDSGIDQGIKDLASDPEVSKGDQSMPEGSDVALVKKKEGETAAMGMTTNPISISFLILLIIMSLNLQNPLLQMLSSPFVIYAVIGFCIIPFSEFGIAGDKIKKLSRRYFDIPEMWFNSFINYFSHGKA